MVLVTLFHATMMLIKTFKLHYTKIQLFQVFWSRKIINIDIRCSCIRWVLERSCDAWFMNEFSVNPFIWFTNQSECFIRESKWFLSSTDLLIHSQWFSSSVDNHFNVGLFLTQNYDCKDLVCSAPTLLLCFWSISRFLKLESVSLHED